MKNSIPFVCFCMCLFLSLPNAVCRASAQSTNQLTGVISLAEEIRTGCAPDIKWIRGTADLKPMGMMPLALPISCANTRYLPVVRSQLLNNCGAFAPSYYYKTYQEARERGWVHPDPSVNPERVMSPGFTYPLVNHGLNSGVGLSTVMAMICRYGIATWQDMPENGNWWNYPADDIWEKAMPYRGDRVIAFDLNTAGGMQAMKQHLSDGDLGVFNVQVSANFANYPYGAGVNNGVLYTNGVIYDLHALTLIGYDDARTYNDGTGMKTGAFLAVNSWGCGWGVVEPSAGTAGFCWLSYEYMRISRGDSYVLAMIDRTNYVPREVAVIEAWTEARSELQLTITSGNGVGSTNALEAFPQGGGAMSYYGTITVDVTDFMGDRPDAYRLSARDWQSATVGTLRRFEVRKANGVVLTCPDVPVTLANVDMSLPAAIWPITHLDVGVLAREDQSIWTTPSQASTFAWADFDLDGDADMVFFGGYEQNIFAALYINDGNGRFTQRDTTLPLLHSVRVAWGDYNRDGYPDLAVSGRTLANAPAMRLFRNVGGGTLVDSGIALPQVETALAWGDYDQDGDVDLATSSGKLLRNNNGTNFTDTAFALLGGDTSKSISWADMDNDGLLDLEINGKINQNLGGSFTNDALNGPKIGSFGEAPPIWYDFNGDGLLDAAAGGRIYQNKGAMYHPGYNITPDEWQLRFAAMGPAFPNWMFPRVSAGDYDNDGDLDLAMSGAVLSSADVRCSVFRQESDRSFTDIGLHLAGMYSGCVGWQDWDGDGDLDLLAAGMSSSFVPQMEVLKSRLADYGLPNKPPKAPQRFQTTLTGFNLLLQWHPAEDAETPASRLAYEIRVGHYPGCTDVVSPCDSGPMPGNAQLIGALSLPAAYEDYAWFQNTNGLPGLRLRNVAAGRYYWSVRTVDGGRARSPWSAEQSFTMTGAGLRLGDINGDGKVDVADLVRCRKMIAGSVSPVVATADLNNDGVVNEPDAIMLTSLLLETEAGGYVPMAEATIGTAGGTLSNGLFSLTVPAGAFAESSQLQLLMAADDGWFGAHSPRLMWRIAGLPLTMTGTLTLRGPDLRAGSNTEVVMALGQWIRPHGVNDDTMEAVRSFSTVTGTVSGGRLVAQVPANLLHDTAVAAMGAAGPIYDTLAAEPPVARGTFIIDTGWFWDTCSLKTSHFVIYWDGLVQPAYVVSLATELEAAFVRFKTMGYAFESKRDWVKYPVQVLLRALDNEGGEVHYTDNSAYLELNVKRLEDEIIRRTTVNHELFHLVQGLVNPAYSVTEARDQRLLLVNEATATWMERFGAAAPADYVPSIYLQNQLEVFNGLSYGAVADAAHTGYAMSSLMTYLAEHFGEGTILNIYTRIAAGDAAVKAVLNSVPNPLNLSWHPDFYQSLLEGSVYAGSRLINISPKNFPLWPVKEHTFTAISNVAAKASFNVMIPGLGADGWRVAFTPGSAATLSDASVLALSLKNPREDLTLSVVSAKNWADARGTIPVESYGAIPTIIRSRVRNLKSALLPLPANPLIGSLRSFIALVTRTDSSEPDVLKPSQLNMAVAEQLDGELRLPEFTHGEFHCGDNLFIFPQFKCNAKLAVHDLTGLFEPLLSKPAPGEDQGFIFLTVFQDGPIPLDFVFSAVPMGATPLDVPETIPNSFDRYTFESISRYMISKRRVFGPKWEDQPYVFEPRTFSGVETLQLETADEIVYYVIEIIYTIQRQNFTGVSPNGTPVGDPVVMELNATPVFIYLTRE